MFVLRWVASLELWQALALGAALGMLAWHTTGKRKRRYHAFVDRIKRVKPWKKKSRLRTALKKNTKQ